MRSERRSKFKKIIIQNDPYFQKWYTNKLTLLKVAEIHERLEEIQFPHIVKIYKVRKDNIIQKWLTDYQITSYGNAQNCKKVLNALTALHETNQQINWLDVPFLQKLNVNNKWVNRVQMYQEIEYKLPYKFRIYSDRILQRAKTALSTGSKQQAKHWTICHGDVAHHNFLIHNDDIKIIDFDLAYLGNPEDEKILWMQRVLPFMEYDLYKLVKENPNLMNHKGRFSMLLFPNELLREAIHLTRLEGKAYKKAYEFLQWLFEVTISNDKKLQNHIEIVQKSNNHMLK